MTRIVWWGGMYVCPCMDEVEVPLGVQENTSTPCWGRRETGYRCCCLSGKRMRAIEGTVNYGDV
mgnify:CR=1 FL=1